jgi:hypothetical protein
MSLMMMTNHPITPPPELVQQWYQEADSQLRPYYVYIAIRAAQWGADQELEACCEWLDRNNQWAKVDIDELRDARRPKPPSLKEQALEALQFVDEKLGLPLHNHCNAIHTIRRALEQLDD